jgi:pilus assembly protein TadC
MNAWSATLIATALLVLPSRSRARARLAALLAPSPGRGHRAAAGVRRRAQAGPFRLAATWDILAACLRAGLPVATAIRVITEELTGPESAALGATADLLALGADPVAAWAPARACAGTAELARAARRTARSGSALAEVAEELAAQLRTDLADGAEARAQRAAVLIAGPLALCFLPAFLCLGVVPVVLGLAGRLTMF